MKPTLRTVSTELPDPPYPVNTKSGAFAFDLEVDRMLASDMWILTSPEIRPWCVLSWVISWNLVPCGSLPNDPDVISARLGCTRDFFDLHRSKIMRGWVLHNDDRFYHPVITEKVFALLAERAKWRNKKSSPGIPRGNSGDSPGTPQGLPPSSRPSYSSSSSSSSSSSTHTNTSEGDSRARAHARPSPPDGVDAELWNEFLKLRIKLKATNSDRAMKLLNTEMNRIRAETGESYQSQIERSLLNGWKSVYPRKTNDAKPAKPADENRMRGRLFQNGEWMDENPIPLNDLLARARERQAT